MTSNIKLRCINEKQIKTLNRIYREQANPDIFGTEYWCMIDYLQAERNFRFIKNDGTIVWVGFLHDQSIDIEYQINEKHKVYNINLEGEIVDK